LDPSSFQWIQVESAQANVLAFIRRSNGRHLVCVANLSPAPKQGYRIGLPQTDPYIEVLNTDLERYGGSGVTNAGHILPEVKGWDAQPASYSFALPPLSVLWLVPASQLG